MPKILQTSLCAFLALSVPLCAQKKTDSTGLIKKALEAHLVPMPTGKDLDKYLEQRVRELGLAYKGAVMTKGQIELGKKLYLDPRISTSYLISCNTCHNLGLAGVDLVSRAVGEGWKPNPHFLNSPTVYNSVFNTVQFWDGRVAHLDEQAKGPISNPVEMNADPKIVEAKINSMPGYVKAFKRAYGNNIKIDLNLITDTIAMFEATLVTPSRYDDFLRGNTKAMSRQEQEGLKVFLDKGCAGCHNGINLGGMMQPFQVAAPYKFANVGDFKGDKNGMVKVPTLRNVLETMPYFHNGQYWDIKDAIKEMGAIQLGITINDEEAQKIATFFNALTGKKPTIIYPDLPVMSASTPKPQGIMEGDDKSAKQPTH
ncbi:Cytochrome c551 peroxidase [Helicobacter sp. NHP19-003]|uniref:Cytochrome c551 peroxidase n=1 Tax=Helicobacter gastrocanis TaxID=2849641 RepID=A0ABM7SBT8_9HELI|nr:Cytochrome c551 peroxidase [Helicobacter sp. NHP19-003]